MKATIIAYLIIGIFVLGGVLGEAARRGEHSQFNTTGMIAVVIFWPMVAGAVGFAVWGHK